VTVDVLSLFLPPVAQWFRQTLGEPTLPQRQGWPAIADGQNALILAPTGSGKTLAAFLACLDALWRQEQLARQVQVLYISPLKALNYDIHRNLQVPLEGILATARQTEHHLPELTVAVRTGDTPARERQQLARRPPHVLITTPESLHLILTSQARSTLCGVRYCIVDEIHALCANKRGVFLALLLERLEALNPRSFVRIGLSATQRPLEEVARFLGGGRPVTIIDAGLGKNMDLQVVCPVEQFGPLPEQSVWPSIYRLLLEEVRRHRSTIIFGNNRRVVERVTTELNELAGAENDLARAHHGSISLEVRRQTEQALKEGRLPAVVATASLELGIDMGAVELVCQVESPGSVSRGLQRVGRAGHLVGRTSKGRLIAKTLPDLVEQAVLAREMAAGRVEELHVPMNCLDVLAQQVVALVALESWDVPRLYALVRQAYPYRDLSPEAFESVLEMVSGRYPAEAFQDLRPRISWDRVHNRLHALPGSQQLALVNGGTIPDTGQYAAYIDGRDIRIGELDEEFVYERRIGDTFVLGTNAWRIEQIEADRVFVSPAAGAPAMMPFWRGERVGRSRDLGLAMGRFLRELAERLPQPDCLDWLRAECRLDRAAAWNLQHYVRRQIERVGCVPTDQTLLVEAFRDQVGDWHVAILSPLGSRLNLALRLAVEARFRQRFGYQPQCLHHDDGLLLRLADVEEPPLDLLDDLRPEEVEKLILGELADSALFAIRFRQNAARALLMPRTQPDRRAPLWLQRLKARSLLQIARQYPSFPVVVETYRECLQDHLDVPRLQQLLHDLREGRVTVVRRRAETPSPFAASLLFGFTAAFMYDYDRVDPRRDQATEINHSLLEQILTPDRHQHLLEPQAVRQVELRLRGLGQLPRTAEEMAEWLRRLGDLSASEVRGPMASFLQELEQAGRVRRIRLDQCAEPERWILVEAEPDYALAFGLPSHSDERLTPRSKGRSEATETILQRFLQTHALVGLADVLSRYPFDEQWASQKLAEWSQSGQITPLPPADQNQSLQWAAPANLEQVQRLSLALRRREILTCPPHQFADFVLRWQYRHPECRQQGVEGLSKVLHRLQGLPITAELWERTVLPGRVVGYQTRWLDELSLAGEWTWACQHADDHGPGAAAFLLRELLPHFARPSDADMASDPETGPIYEHLRQKGASFVLDIAQALNLAPTRVRAALWRLLRCSLVTNDRYDVVRRGEDTEAADPGATTGRPSLRTLRRQRTHRPEGRWSLVPWGVPDPETRAIQQAHLLLERYGIVARELALLDPWMLPWRVLYEVFSRLEWAGEVRRGYFVEGLSGAQFASPEAAQQLADHAMPAPGTEPAILLHTLDPANLYGAGAPLQLDAEAAMRQAATAAPTGDDASPSPTFARRMSSWLVLRGGRPILLVEGHGKRLTTCAPAGHDDLVQAAACLGDALTTGQGMARGKITVAEWNGRPIAGTEGCAILESAGFLRDYQAMTLYAAWK
jgi:ATP-dependent Lhr-like helicase